MSKLLIQLCGIELYLSFPKGDAKYGKFIDYME